MEIEFNVYGEPRAKQSFRVGNGGGGYQTARVKGWQADVGWAAQQVMRRAKPMLEPLGCDVLVDLTFYLGDKRRVDLDNLSKAVLDGLNGICWEDDRQVVDLHIRKILSDKEEAGVLVKITPKETIE
jgi:crossover junction endodeoxyribonuclease RusA